MKRRPFRHLADQPLLRTLAELAKNDQVSTATILACIAEVDERKLYRPAGYSTMYLFLVHEMHMSEDVAFKRIRAARAGRRFPAIFDAVTEGRLHLSAVVMLAPHLTPDNAAELLAAAEHRTKAEIELLLARRFPQPDLPTFIGTIAPQGATGQPAIRPVGAAVDFRQLAPGPVATITETNAPMLMAPLPSRARVAPLSPGRTGWQLTVDDETQDLYDYTAAMLGHSILSGDMAAVLKRVLEIASRHLERQKFAKCVRTRPRRGAPKGRYIPAEVRRTVWQRDGGQCTFVSACGKRCESMTRLEFDHIDPVARGGQASVDRMRLRCRAHNQYEAERTFGAGFMQNKRDEARCRTSQVQAREQEHAREQAHACEDTHAREQAQRPARSPARPPAVAGSANQSDVLPWLRRLGFSAEEARRGAADCAHIPDAPLDQRVRVALRGLAPNCVRRPAPLASGPA